MATKLTKAFAEFVAAARPRRAVGRRRAGVGAGEEVGIAFTISVSAAQGAQGGRRDVLGCLRQ